MEVLLISYRLRVKNSTDHRNVREIRGTQELVGKYFEPTGWLKLAIFTV